MRVLMPGTMACRLPNAPIDVMCNQWAKAAYDICPFVNNTHVYDTEGVNTGADYTEALGVIKVSLGRCCHPIPSNSPGHLLGSANAPAPCRLCARGVRSGRPLGILSAAGELRSNSCAPRAERRAASVSAGVGFPQ